MGVVVVAVGDGKAEALGEAPRRLLLWRTLELHVRDLREGPENGDRHYILGPRGSAKLPEENKLLN